MSEDKNSRIKKYEERQKKLQKEQEKPETHKVIGWDIVNNQKIYEDKEK